MAEWPPLFGEVALNDDRLDVGSYPSKRFAIAVGALDCIDIADRTGDMDDPRSTRPHQMVNDLFNTMAIVDPQHMASGNVCAVDQNSGQSSRNDPLDRGAIE